MCSQNESGILMSMCVVKRPVFFFQLGHGHDQDIALQLQHNHLQVQTERVLVGQASEYGSMGQREGSGNTKAV